MPIVGMPDGTKVQFPDDMPADQIRSLILQKFPNAAAQAADPAAEYANKSIGDVASEAVSNIPSSAGKFAQDMVHPILHPIETAESLYGVAKGFAQKSGLVSGDDSEKYADALMQHFSDRYGSVSGFKKAVAQDPVGVLADISTVLTGGGALAAKAGGVAGKVGEAAKIAGDITNPINIAMKGAQVVGKGAAKTAELISGGGVNYASLVKSAEAGGKGLGSAESNAYWENLSKSVPMQQVVEMMKDALAKMQADAGVEYRAGMKQIGTDATVLDFSRIDQALEKIAGVKTYKGQELSPSTKSIRDDIKADVADWKKLNPAEYHTPEGLDALKQKIGDLRDSTEKGTPSRLVADQVYQAIKKTIQEQAPTYEKVMSGYAEAKNEINKISKELSGGENVNPGTALRKLQSVMRDGVNTSYGYRQQLMEKLVDAGAETLPYALAGQDASSILPRGLAGKLISSGAAGAVGLTGAAHAAGFGIGAGVSPWTLAALPAMSPMIAGATSYGVGLAGRVLDRPYSGLAAAQTSSAIPPIEGSRLAPDGNWYLPDAKRPGKYLQVVH